MRSEGGRYSADILNFIEPAGGHLEPVRRLYVHACHGSADDGEFVARLGYRVPDRSELELDRPRDIFAHIR
jgi:hypothetical protein